MAPENNTPKLTIRQRAVLSVAEKTGMDRAEADRLMTAAKKKYGIRYADYDKYDFFAVPDYAKALKAKQIVMDKERREKNKELRAECIKLAVEKCGMDEVAAEKAFTDAKADYGLTAAEYLKWEFCCVPDVEKANVISEINAVRENNKLRAKKFREQCIALAMEKMSWTHEEAEADLDETRKRLGCGYSDYRRLHLFAYSKEEQAEMYLARLCNSENREQRDSDKRERFIAEIKQITGWTEEEVAVKVDTAKYMSEASLKDYYCYRFWEIPEEEQRTYFTQYFSNKLRAKYDNNIYHKDIINNKELSCREFSEFMNRAWCINRGIDLEKFRVMFDDINKVIYKPLEGNGGIGIKVFDIVGEQLNDTFDQLMNLPRGLVEAYVVQHAEMNRIAPNSVNTIRIVSVTTEEWSKVAYAAMRCGSGKSFVDNFTEGGMVAGVDLNTGTVVTNGVTINGDVREYHPETGTKFKGFVIPYFKEALELVEKASKKVTGYIGWDIAISEEGPVLIEVNLDPGNRILQMPYVEERIGMRHIMEEFA